jgi:hypothetical protein
VKIKRLAVLLLLTAIFAMSFAPAAAFAAEDCGCDITQVTGAEKNKIVSNMLKSDAFKAKKQELQQQGYQLQGVSGAEVERNNDKNAVLIAIPLLDPTGQTVYLIHVYGQFFVVAL